MNWHSKSLFSFVSLSALLSLLLLTTGFFGSSAHAAQPEPAAQAQQEAINAYRSPVPAPTTESFAPPAAVSAVASAASPVSEAAGEVLQILGQIVVDRATEAAYQRARDEILRLLGCPGKDKTKDAGAPVLLGSKIEFARTCRVVASLRIQDLAMSRAALFQALLEDVLLAMRDSRGVWPRTAPVQTPGETEDGWAVATELLMTSVLPELPRLIAAGSSSAMRDVVWQIVQRGIRHAGTAIATCQSDACRTMALAAVAVIQCRAEAASAPAEKREATLRACPVEDHVERLSADPMYKPEMVATAKTIASEWMSAQTAVTADGKPDHRARGRFAVQATFDVACLWLDPNQVDKARCPAALEAPEDATLARRGASLARLLIVAAVDGDTNTVIAGLGRGVELVLKEAVGGSSMDPKEKKGFERALRLLGAILQYAETFTDVSAKTDTRSLHERRTKILESLTRDMTDRTGREDDDIFSVGGSLRAVAGFRFDPGGGAAKPTFFGPVSLPLGLGYQSAGHFHLELSLFDLGQYVSYQESKTGLEVREPKPLDALSPSITVGGYWGKSFPIFLGLTAGYSPQYTFSKNATNAAGSVNFGLTAGVYVPLFDLN